MSPSTPRRDPAGALRFRRLVTLGGSGVIMVATILLISFRQIHPGALWLAGVLVAVAVADSQAAGRRTRRR